MNDLAFLEDWLAKPDPGAIEAKNGSYGMLDKPLDSGNVTVNAEGFVPDTPAQAKTVDQPIGKTAKESILPQVRKVADTKEKAATILTAAVPDINEVPVPTGGIGLLLFISLLVVFAISPSDPTDSKSPSRLSLLWGSVLGNYTYKKAAGAATGPSSFPSSSSKSSAPALPSGSFYNSVIQGSAT
jgi:hypothetical protein